MTYRIFGSELSPYSVKVRSFARYKNIDHEWIVRSAAVSDEFARYARLPLVPLVVTPEDEGMQDSTPIMETLEERFPEPSVMPKDPVLGFLSALLEEYADEWGNKPMFHYRWAYEADQISTAERIAASTLGADAGSETVAEAAARIRERMVARRSFVGSHDGTAEQIEGSFKTLVELLDRHLESRPYVLGGRPGMADFGLWAQLYEASTDPTPGEYLRANSTYLMPWIETMLSPSPQGEFEDWTTLADTLTPLFRREVSALFLPWSLANAAALEAGEPEFTVVLDGREFTQATQKYHARSLAALRSKYDLCSDKERLDPILEDLGCLAAMAG